MSKFLYPEMERLERAQVCSLCQSQQGLLAAKVAFWDLQTSNVVQCAQCLHIQLDPKLTEKATQLGCLAYYLRESQGIPQHEQKRNRLRNFRRGVLFGRTLKHSSPDIQSVLEFGPGDGFFLQGLKFVFPNIKITVLDIVEDVLKYCESVHGYATLLGSPDSDRIETSAKFDLVIARDVIEHVNDVPKMFSNLKDLLKVGGLFHFLTPNGYEDVWGHAMLWKNEHQVSELLINHVNYFEGHSLQNHLAAQGLEPVKYYTYKFKDFFRGKGRNQSLRWSRPLTGVKAADFIDAAASPRDVAESEAGVSDKNASHLSPVAEVYREWYVTPKMPWLTYAVSAYHHLDVFRVSPTRNVGHEIFGLFRRKAE